MLKRIASVLIFIIFAVLIFAAVRSYTLPGHLYYKTGSFQGCPARPSCVSSRAESAEHAIAPIRYSGDPARAFERLREAVEGMPGATVLNVSEGPEGRYLHAVFVTPTMRFRDDLELLLDNDTTVEVRSVSRFGYRDFGVNRARVEQLRLRFTMG
jgi:uncharacterized protein (DUF1499 family)